MSTPPGDNPQSVPPSQWGAPPAYAQPRQHAPGAVASLVCGILGFVAIPLLLSIVAVVLGYQSKRETEANPHRYDDSLGQAGRILGWIGIVLFGGMLLLLVLIFFVIVLAAV